MGADRPMVGDCTAFMFKAKGVRMGLTMGHSPQSTLGPEELDESLMGRFQTGEGEAFDLLFDRLGARLINFAYRFLHSREEAEDVAQETLLRVHGARERYDPSRPFRPWLFSIAARLISNRLRQKRRHPILSLFRAEENDPPSPRQDPPAPAEDLPEHGLEKAQRVAVVRAALARLPENQRTAVVLARFEEMSYEDIAQTLGVSVSSVKSLLFRARQNLKNDLKQLF